MHERQGRVQIAERLARLEAEVERRGRLAAEARLSSQSAPVDTEYQREEERLRSPDTTEMERWQIQANRTLELNCTGSAPVA